MTESDMKPRNENAVMEAIGRRIHDEGEEDIPLTILKAFYDWQVRNLSTRHLLAVEKKENARVTARIFTRLTRAQDNAERVRQKIQNLGDRGGGVMGQGSIDDTHNVPR